MKNSNKILLLVIGVLLLITGGIAFAYFITQAGVVGSGAKTEVQTATINNTTLTIEGTLEFDDLDILPGHKALSIVKVTATGDLNVLYNLIWKGTNTLNTSLNYKVYKTDTLQSPSITCTKKDELQGSYKIYYEECTENNFDGLGEIIETGTIGTAVEETKITLVTDELIIATPEGETVYYYVILEYPNLEESQNIDMGGSFEGIVTVEDSDANHLVAVGTNSDATSTFLGSSITREEIESVTTLDNISIPESGVIESYDVSVRQDGSIMAWYTDIDSDNLYEVYIGQEGGVIANPNSSRLFQNLTNATTIDVSNLNTSGVTNMEAMFRGAANLTSLDSSHFNTTNVTNMNNMFRDTSNLVELDLSSFDTSNVRYMAYMFVGSNLPELDLSSFDTSSVTNMDAMFRGAANLTSLDLSHFNTTNVTNMNNMFRDTSNLVELDLSSFDTSNVRYMAYMFVGSNLPELDLSNFNTVNVTDMNNMFQSASITKLDLSSFNTANVTNMYSMFRGAVSLTSLNLNSFDTSNVTNMGFMFSGAYNLMNLDLSSFDTSNVTDISSMFANTNKLETLKFNKATFDNVTSYGNMFYGSTVSNITIKDEVAKTFIEARLTDVGKSATVTIAS